MASIQDFQDKAIATAMSSPYLLAFGSCAFFWGHIWVFLIGNVIKKKYDKERMLDSMWGKTGIGLIWGSLVTLPMYMIEKRTLNISTINFPFITSHCVVIILMSFIL